MDDIPSSLRHCRSMVAQSGASSVRHHHGAPIEKESGALSAPLPFPNGAEWRTVHWHRELG
jgi:hypothetical protein